MRIRPVTPVLSAPRFLRDRQGRAHFTDSSPLAATIQDMISSNSLAAFTAEVSRGAAMQASQQASRAPSPAGETARGAARSGGRLLETVPPPPGAPLPRGSLLDLRV